MYAGEAGEIFTMMQTSNRPDEACGGASITADEHQSPKHSRIGIMKTERNYRTWFWPVFHPFFRLNLVEIARVLLASFC
jgi:hypothetical protein